MMLSQTPNVATRARTSAALALVAAMACASGQIARAPLAENALSLKVVCDHSSTGATEVNFDIVNCGSHAERFIEPTDAGSRWYFWVDPDGVDVESGSCSGTVHASTDAVVLGPGSAWRVPCERIEPPRDATDAWSLRIEVDLQTDRGRARLVTIVPPGATVAGGCRGER